MNGATAAAIYARISSDQDGTGLGVQRQIEDCRVLAESRGWTVAQVFTDNDVSAYSGKRRPQFDQMCQAMRDGHVDAVIVYHLDRLTRRPKELEEFVELCDSCGIKNLATVAGDVNIGTGDGLLVARIQAAVAANESASKSRRITRKMRQLAESGMPHGGSNRPFGYESDAITINQPEAAIIRDAAQRIIAGESLRSVTSWLSNSGVPTVNGAEWRTSTVRLMLTNPRLVGMRTHRGEVIGKGVWEPILTESEQQQVISRLEQRRQANRRAPRAYLLSGLLRCGKCGNKLYSSRRVDSRRYVCLSGPDHGGCGRLTVVAHPLEQFVADMVLHTLDTPDLADALSGADRSPQADALRDQLQSDQQQLEELAGLYADKRMTAREWMLARDPIQARIDATRMQLANQVHAHALSELLGQGSRLRDQWDTLNLDRQAAIVRTVIDHIVISPGQPGARTLDPARVHPVWLF